MTRTLEELRREIDVADRRIASEYAKRLQLVREVGETKKQSGTAVLQTGREAEVIENAVAAAGEQYRAAVTYLFRDIMDYSKEEQSVLGGKGDTFLSEILSLPVRENFRCDGTSVACQGVAGAFSHIAAESLFPNPKITFVRAFKDVFAAVSSGESAFGVLPIENSTAGSVNEVYDLLTEYGLKIVAAKKVKVSHNILGVRGASLQNIARVYSHPQALAQCRKTLDAMKIEERREVSNTAYAAKCVAESGDPHAAAIASGKTAELYGLDILKTDAQDSHENYTRFIVVAHEKFTVSAGNKISAIVSIDHREGALHRLLGIFAAAKKNLIKLESRPIPDKNFEFLFYVDLEANVAEADTREMLRRVGAYCKTAVFLGGYSED